MTAKTLMIQGTMSSAGKSLLVTGLCRVFARRGLRVAPYKAQNMSNNAAVCPDGGEMGRAQFTQAQAAGCVPEVAMNPVLLKPEADWRSQVVVMGRPWQTLAARGYYERKAALWDYATAALDDLRGRYELVLIEGAGSPVELNLRRGDIVNMAIARYAQSPVLLAGDIDRGGIFAQMLGTLWLLEDDERTLVKGLLVNKFRGDRSLFDDGVAMLEARGGVPVLGVIPYLRDLGIPEEDAVALDEPTPPAADAATRIALIHLPHIANFDDFDPLRREPGVQLDTVRHPGQLGQPDAVILPGTKSTLADLDWLRRTGLADAITRLAQSGAAVVGICGGYQMLGRVLRDPQRIESQHAQAEGLGLLDHETDFIADKATYQAGARLLAGPGWLSSLEGLRVSGYEIHMGRTRADAPWLRIEQRGDQAVAVPDGHMSADGRLWGCYLHGLFHNAPLRRAWLRSLGWDGPDAAADDDLEAAFDRLADHLEAHIDMQQLERILHL